MNITLGSDNSVAVTRGEKITRGQSRSKLIKVNWRSNESPPELPISNTKHIGIESLIVQVNITRPDGEYSGWQDMIKVDGEISYYYPLQKWDTEVSGKAQCQIRWFKAGDDGDDDDTTVQTSNQISFVIDNGVIAQTLLPTLADYTTWQAIIAILQSRAFRKFDITDLSDDAVYNVNGKKSAPAIFYNYSDGTNAGTLLVSKATVSTNVIQTETLLSNGNILTRKITFAATDYNDSTIENPTGTATEFVNINAKIQDLITAVNTLNTTLNGTIAELNTVKGNQTTLNNDLRNAMSNLSVALTTRMDELEENLSVDLELSETKRLYLIGTEGNKIGNGIPLPDSVNGFVVQQDENGNDVLYLAYDEEIVGEGVVLPKGGGGGGGSSAGGGSVIRITNGMPAKSFTISQSALETASEYLIGYSWSSTDSATSESTGNGSISWFVNGNKVATQANISQGEQTFNIKPFLIAGAENTVKVSIVDTYGATKSFVWYISVSSLSVSWNLGAIEVHGNNAITVRATVNGAGDKTLHITLDGTEVETTVVSTSGRVISYNIDAQSHGVHTITAWLTATVDGESISTTPLVHKGIWTATSNTTPIIAVVQDTASIVQFETGTLNYFVYDPQNETASVSLKEGDAVVSSVSVARQTQSWAYRPTTTGTKTLSIVCGAVTATITVTVTALGFDVSEVSGTNIKIDPTGHTNSESGAHEFGYIDGNGTKHTFTYSSNFDWDNGGFQTDSDGVTAFVIKKGCYIELDRSLFNDNARNDGKEIKIVFKTADVRNYDTEILKCLANDIGIKLQANQATVSCSTEKNIVIPYCEGKKIEFDFNIESDREGNHRFAMVWLSGVPSRAFVYSDSASWTQTNAQNLRIGSADADIWLYKFKMYPTQLTRHEIIDNYIADCSDVSEMRTRYERNNIFNDAKTKVDIEKLANANPDLRIIHISAERMTTSKSDDVYCTVRHILRSGSDAHNFTATHVKMKAQGTSSLAYGAAALNLDLDFSSAASWEDGAGNDMDSYAMTDNSVAVNYFNIKLNVASSENANNVCLADDYNNFQPFLPAQRQADSKVRDTVEGHACAIFFTNTSGQTIQVSSHTLTAGETILYGCGDMNNSKKNYAVFGQNNNEYPNQCCIEILNNNADQCLFKSDDLTGERFDGDGNFEARYPKTLTSAMKTASQTMLSWVVSTDRNASGLTDAQKAERAAKFRTELANYFSVDSLLWHYLFTERHCMVDNRAKNCFISYEYDNAAEGYRWNFNKDYDNDTADGNDNTGGLTFTYGLEDTDTVNDAMVFNAYDSVLWVNIRDLMKDELEAMYKNRESAGAWSATRILAKFKAYQGARPEALVAEDMWAKYLEPYIASGETRYFEMLYGTKEDQRTQFETYQERYCASKYSGSLATSDLIELRAMTNVPGWAGVQPSGNMTIKAYSDMYITVKYGNAGTVKTRAKRNTATTITCPTNNLNDTETYIYLSSNITEITGIAALYTSKMTLSYAAKLQKLELGSGAVGYRNNRLTTVSFGNNFELKYIDLRGTPNVVQSLDLAHLTSLETLYCNNSGITGVTFPVGAPVKTLVLSALSVLIMRNMTEIESFTMSGANLTRLWIEGTSGVDTYSLVEAASNLESVKLTNIDWDNADTDLLLKLATLKGLSIDERGNIVETTNAIITGSAHVEYITSAELSTLASVFPNLTVTYDTLASAHTVTWKNYDGTVLYTESVRSGKTPTSPITRGLISIPTKPNTTTNKYQFTEWSGLGAITEDTIITASFQEMAQTYAVRFHNTTDDTYYEATGLYGGSAVYAGSNIITSQTLFFQGWKDQYGNDFAEYTVNLTAANCFLDGNNNPVQINVESQLMSSVPVMPSVSNGSGISGYSWPEITALAHAIEGKTVYDTNGTQITYTTTYDATNKAYIITQTSGANTGVVSVVAIGDTKDILMNDNLTVTMKVHGLMRDKDENDNDIGITFASAHLYGTKTFQMNSGNKTVAKYTIGGAAKTGNYTYTHSGEDAYVDIIATDDTHLSSVVKTSSGVATYFYFNGTTGTDDSTHDYKTFAATDNVASGSSATWNCLTLEGAITKTGAFTQLLAGAKIRIPVTAGDTVAVNCYSSMNNGGYKYSAGRTYATGSVFNNIPAWISVNITAMKKTSEIGGTSSLNYTVCDKTWLLMYADVTGSSAYPIYTNDSSRIKKYSNGTGSAHYWWLGSAYSGYDYSFWIVDSYGSLYGYYASYGFGVAFGFGL